MKSIFLSAIALVASASSAAAAITVITPWADTTWTAGGHGNITWNTAAADNTKDCHIQLMNGNATNSNMVAYVTAPDTPVKCSVKSYDIYPLNDFAAGDYWIRVGQTDGSWGYSGVFKFKGNGTARPYQLASGASAAAAAATGASSSGKSSGTSTASQAAQSDESAAMSLSAQGKSFVALAGGAVAAAMALAM